MKLINRIFEVVLIINTFLLVLFGMMLSISLYQVSEKKYEEILLIGRDLLVSEIILFLLYNYLQEKPIPMKTLKNFFGKVKSLDFYAPIFMFISFVSIYYTFGFITLYQDKHLGLFYGILFYLGVFFGFTCVGSFTYITYKYANDDDEDLGVSENSPNDAPMGDLDSQNA